MVRSERVTAVCAALFVLLALAGCTAERKALRAAREPQVEATVYTIRTLFPSANRSTVHELVVSGDRARFTNEIDRWRLFDLRQRKVTFVDDVAKTYKTSTFDQLVAQKRNALRLLPEDDFPRVQFAAGGEHAKVAGFDAVLYVMTVGAYRRELWMSDSRSLPVALFPLVVASDPPRGSHAGMMHDAFEAMLALHGFPVAEHAKLDAGSAKFEMDRRVEKIERKSVAESLVTIPRDYRDVTPTAPPAGRPSAASPPSDQNARGAE